jgi:sigma-B regulation protein RsbU (phosphoserine phosphatase)
MSVLHDGPVTLDAPVEDWDQRLALVVATMREMSQQTDPQEMSRAYRQRMRLLRPVDRMASISRRDLAFPHYRITRSSLWKEDINPWKEKERLPLLAGGFMGELLYGDEPQLFDELSVPADDPAAEYFTGMRSLAAIPMYDRGEALNMILLMKAEPAAFQRKDFADLVWQSNLYGRATHNLVLSEQLKEAYEAIDDELQAVANIQRSLLPSAMPKIPTLAVAAHYQTSRRAGGDYYDFFPLPDGQWGILIADVSGHGTPAAVLMAVTHSLAHTYPGPPTPPSAMLDYVNAKLSNLYTAPHDTFVTAFYGIYNPAERLLTYAAAGHNPPRLKRCTDGTLDQLDGVRGLPLGINPAERYHEASHRLLPGDQLMLYTDGITEAYNEAGEMFGLERLDQVLEHCSLRAPDLLREVLAAVDTFTGGRPPDDDRTLLVLKVS